MELLPCDYFTFHSFLPALSMGLSNVMLFLPLLLTVSNVTNGCFVHLVLPCRPFSCVCASDHVDVFTFTVVLLSSANTSETLNV